MTRLGDAGIYNHLINSMLVTWMIWNAATRTPFFIDWFSHLKTEWRILQSSLSVKDHLFVLSRILNWFSEAGFKIRGAVERVLSGADRPSSATLHLFIHTPLHRFAPLKVILDSEQVLVKKLSKRCLKTLLEVLEQYVSVQSPVKLIFAKEKLKNC